jgi:hypothetical protein
MYRTLVLIMLATSSIQPERTSFPRANSEPDHFALDMQ